MAKRTYNITRFDGGRNSKYDPRDIAEEEIAEAINVGVINPGFATTGGSFRNFYNASDNAIQSHSVSEFEHTSATVSKNNTSLFSFNHDYGVTYKVHFDTGVDTSIQTIGNVVTDGTTGASGEIVGTSDLSGSDGSRTGYIYLKDVTQSTLTACSQGSATGTPFAENAILRIGGTQKGNVHSSIAVVNQTTEKSMICLGDANTLDIYDDSSSQWLTNVMTLSNGETWDATGTSSNTSSVYHRFFFADGAVRMNDANLENTNNYPGWFGHIKREYLQNVLEWDGTAKTRDVVKYNSWFEDVMAPAPPSNTNEKALTVTDFYHADNYPSRGEKVLLQIRESNAQLSISGIALTDANTGLMTATCNEHNAIGLNVGDEITIQGSAHGGTYNVDSIPSTTTFTFFSNSTTAASSLEGSEKVQDGTDPNPGDSNWATLDIDGNADGWTSADPPVYSDDETASLINTLASNIEAGKTYVLQFEVETADLDLSIGAATSADTSTNLADTYFFERATYSAGVYKLVFTADGDTDYSHLWFTAYQDNSGGGKIDDVSLKEASCSVRKVTEQINQDLRDKWIFGISFLYDGTTTQESPVISGWKKTDLNSDGVTETSLEMDKDVSANYVVDFSNFTNKPECEITFVYDDVNYNVAGTAQNKWWHPRKIGFNIYMKRVDGTEQSDWLLFSQVDLVKGEYVINAGDGKVLPLREGPTTPENQLTLGGGINLIPFNNVPLESYFTQSLGVPEHLTHFRASWKAQAIVNRVNYIGNVYIDGESHPDKIMKSPLLRYDIFPNDSSFVSDIMPADGDEIVHLEAFGDRLLVFKKRSLIVLNVSGSLETIESVHPGLGVLNTRMVCPTDDGIAWINTQGLYFFNGEELKNLIENKFTQVNWSGTQTADSQIEFDSTSKQLVIIISKTQTHLCFGYIYDFFTESFFYCNHLGHVSATGGDEHHYSNIVSTHKSTGSQELLLAYSKSSSSAFAVNFFNWDSAAKDTAITGADGITGTIVQSPGYGFCIKTKDIDFAEPGVKKKIHKVYITYQDSTDHGSQTHNNVIVAYNVNGEGSSSQNFADSNHKHFKPVKNCSSVSPDSGSNNLCILDDNKSEWTVAEMKPATSEANNVNSFQLIIYNKRNGQVKNTFKINDITIVYKMKKKK